MYGLGCAYRMEVLTGLSTLYRMSSTKFSEQGQDAVCMALFKHFADMLPGENTFPHLFLSEKHYHATWSNSHTRLKANVDLLVVLGAEPQN